MNENLSEKIIAMERAALEMWNVGNPSGFLAISTEDVTYYDPFLEKRLDGFAELKSAYDKIEGTVSVDRYEMINPQVQATDSMAVLTYNLNSYSGEALYKWNCTEVYRLEKDGQWKIAHTHWSFVKPLQ